MASPACCAHRNVPRRLASKLWRTSAAVTSSSRLCPVDRGAVDQHVEPPEVVPHAADEVADRRLLGQVGLERRRIDPAAAQVFDRLGRFPGRRAVVDGDVITPAGQGVGDVPPDALLPAAGYQGDPLSDHDHESFHSGGWGAHDYPLAPPRARAIVSSARAEWA